MTYQTPALLTDEAELSYALLKAQAQLRGDSTDSERPTPPKQSLLILVNGMEHAGKGEAVKALSEWMDARHLKVHATLGHHPSHFQPIWQRHTRQLPKHGDIAVYFGNWYADLIRYVFDSGDNLNHDKLSQLMADIEAFEQDLINNGTTILKCWFEVDKKTLKKRLTDVTPDPQQLYHINWQKPKYRRQFNEFSQHLLDQQAMWHRIDGSDTDASTLQFANIVLCQLQALLNAKTAKAPVPSDLNPGNFDLAEIPSALIRVATTVTEKAEYKKQLATKQRTLAKLLTKRGQRHIVLVFEGMDAAGKGGAIKRIIEPLDPREFVIHPIAAPTEDELRHPYLWRFWTRLPHDELVDIDLAHLMHHHKKAYRHLVSHARDSRVTIFDRSWYGRVLVERVEGFAKPHEWQRAYDEINRFEQDLCQSGGVVAKFWLAISSNEELKRFQARETTLNKQHKITDEDWRNRSKWDDYVQAASDMLCHTSTDFAPWHIIASDDKYTARLQVLDALIGQLSKALD